MSNKVRKSRSERSKEGLVEVFTMFITVKGKKLYRKDGRPFHFWAKPR